MQALHFQKAWGCSAAVRQIRNNHIKTVGHSLADSMSGRMQAISAEQFDFFQGGDHMRSLLTFSLVRLLVGFVRFLIIFMDMPPAVLRPRKPVNFVCGGIHEVETYVGPARAELRGMIVARAIRRGVGRAFPKYN